MLRQFPLCVPVTSTFCKHLAERCNDHKPTTYNGKKVYVRAWELSPDQRKVKFTIEEAVITKMVRQ